MPGMLQSGLISAARTTLFDLNVFHATRKSPVDRALTASASASGSSLLMVVGSAPSAPVALSNRQAIPLPAESVKFQTTTVAVWFDATAGSVRLSLARAVTTKALLPAAAWVVKVLPARSNRRANTLHAICWQLSRNTVVQVPSGSA